MALDMLREIQAFVSVAHKRSFVAAARALGRSPSAVTRAVQTLEDNAGSKLLNRNANAVTLTEAGERAQRWAVQILDTLDEFMGELAQAEHVIALSLHVDYWDYIGWKDEFAHPGFTKRQKAYAKAAGERMVYTPQMIVHGGVRVVGHEPEAVAAAIAAAADRPAPVRLTVRRQGGQIMIEVEADPPLTSPAMRHEKFVASNLVIWPMPDLPAKRLAQASATVLPTGLIHPRPVTTTRRRLMRSNLILIARCVKTY
mgnify:CR=1 FL=1